MKALKWKKISIEYAKSIETHQIGILKTRSTTVKQKLQQGILYNDPFFKFFYRGYGVCRMVNQNFLDKSSVYIKFVLLAGPTIKEEQIYSLHVHPRQAS